ncbi:MAG: thioredoxin family protein [Gemmatimonadaceae bacterium]
MAAIQTASGSSSNINGDITNHPVVSRDEWTAARTAFLAREKEFTRLRDDLSRQRRELPWVKVDKAYLFDTANGTQTLADLFEGRSQLFVQHFMFGPNSEAGCVGCSFWADNFDGNGVHLNHRDVTFVAVSRAPLSKLDAFKKRMGWGFNWVSSGRSDFNYDYQASFKPDDIANGTAIYNYERKAKVPEDLPGVSVFYKDASGAIFHTYSTYARGIDILNSAYNCLDLVPKGRDEDALPQAAAWLRHHDRYDV